MKSTDKARLTIVQMNDTHAYFDLHQEMFWQGDHAEYRQAGGYARIATIVNQIRAESDCQILLSSIRHNAGRASKIRTESQ